MSERMDLLFEIGTEELPSGEVDMAIGALADHLRTEAEKARLTIGAIETFATPRRLALIVRGVAERGADHEELAMGPAAKVAFDDAGNPTKAAIGFAKGKGLDIDALQRISTPKGDYVAVTVREEGRAATDILTDILNRSFGAIPWKRSMRWGWGELAFARPIHWIIALLGDQLLDVQFADIRAGRVTRGHRFLGAQQIDVTSVDAWLPALRENFVMASVEERRAMIRRDVVDAAKREGLIALVDEDLVSEVVHLVEWPVPLIGRFDEELLEVPREVLIVSMRTHQRYFPAERADGSLANAFIFISNMIVPQPEVVIAGNLRVLRARLEDARFFWREDRKHTLETRRDDLANIRYIDGLGTLRDRADRISQLAASLVDDYTDGDASLRTITARAGHLSKSDLAAAMVFEFGELQGIMGRYYALAEGEDPAVAQAIDEHYMPRSAHDSVPPSPAGAFVAIADKFDAITGCFALGLKPSGSADPYALRRAAIGLLRIAIERNLRLRVDELAGRAWDLLPPEKIRPRDEVVQEVSYFIRERLRAILSDVPTDIAQAVIAVLGDDLPSAAERARVLMNLRNEADFDALAAGFKRVSNIVSKALDANDALASALRADTIMPKSELLKLDAERALFDATNAARERVAAARNAGSFEEVAQTLIQLKAPIDAFFDAVLVNDEDPAVRENRLALLASLRQVFNTFADISLVQVSQGGAR